MSRCLMCGKPVEMIGLNYCSEDCRNMAIAQSKVEEILSGGRHLDSIDSIVVGCSKIGKTYADYQKADTLKKSKK